MSTPITLAVGRLRAVVVPALGAGIADFSVQGPAGYFFPILRRACPGESNASLLGSFIMAPWVNRIAGARFVFRGEDRVLRANTPEGNAQHGDVRKRPWRVLTATADGAAAEYDGEGVPDSNWPWTFRCRADFTLTPEALTLGLSVTNTDREPFPCGCGHHPYFMRRLWDDGDVLSLRAPVGGRYPLVGGCATGPMKDDELSERLATLAPVPDHAVDDVFGGFGRGASGVAELRWPSSGVRLTMTASANMGHLVVFAPHARADRASPVTNVAVEPQTQVNDAFNLDARGVPGTGTVVLQPGESLETTCRLDVAVDG